MANQPSEFQVLIAHNTGVGRASGFVLIGKVLDHMLLKFGGLIDKIIGNPEFMADCPSVSDRLRAAALIFGARNAILWPELQSNPDYIVTLLEQKRGCSRGVDSTAHADNDACFLRNAHKGMKIR